MCTNLYLFVTLSLSILKMINKVVSIAAEQRDERVKFILEAGVISSLKTFLTSVPQSRLPAVRLIAELVKTGTR